MLPIAVVKKPSGLELVPIGGPILFLGGRMATGIIEDMELHIELEEWFDLDSLEDGSCYALLALDRETETVDIYWEAEGPTDAYPPEEVNEVVP